MFYVYILKSIKSNKTYVGSTIKDINKRLNEHNKGNNIWTRNQRPFKLVYYESYYCKKDSLHREKFLKTGIGNKVVKAIVSEFMKNGA